MKKCSIVLLSILVLSMFSGILNFGAIPPVYATEDTLGYTGTGNGGSYLQTGKIFGSAFTSTEAGTITRLSAYIDGAGGTDTTIGLIYSDNSGVPQTLLANSANVTITDSNYAWYNYTLSYEMQDATKYWFMIYSGGEDHNIGRDDTGGEGYWSAGRTWANIPDPFTDDQTSMGAAAYNYSIYATYTVSGDSTPPTYSGLSSSSTTASSSCQFSATFDDETALPSNGQSRFATNNTGEWVWDTPINFTATPQTISTTKTLNSTVDMIVGYRWNITDNAENLNYTSIQTLTITDVEEVSLRSLVFVALSLAVTAISLVIVGWKKKE